VGGREEGPVGITITYGEPSCCSPSGQIGNGSSFSFLTTGGGTYYVLLTPEAQQTTVVDFSVSYYSPLL
jgi:hypothetical protein